MKWGKTRKKSQSQKCHSELYSCIRYCLEYNWGYRFLLLSLPSFFCEVRKLWISFDFSAICYRCIFKQMHLTYYMHFVLYFWKYWLERRKCYYDKVSIMYFGKVVLQKFSWKKSSYSSRKKIVYVAFFRKVKPWTKWKKFVKLTVSFKGRFTLTGSKPNVFACKRL